MHASVTSSLSHPWSAGRFCIDVTSCRDVMSLMCALYCADRAECCLTDRNVAARAPTIARAALS
jgi:hypothetical protein